MEFFLYNYQIFDIILRPALKHNVSETAYCLRLQVEPIQLGPLDRVGLSVSPKDSATSTF
jgi:hypothetical protein